MDDTAQTTDRSHPFPPPPALVDAVAWVWRTLVLVAGGWVLLHLAQTLYLVVLPFAAGTLLAALGYPLVGFLRRRGAPRWLAVLVAGVGFVAVLGGVGTWVVVRVIAEAPALADSAAHVLNDLPASNGELATLRDRVTASLQHRAGDLAGPALSGLLTASEFLTGVILTLFIALYLLHSGDRVWSWTVSLLPARQRRGLERMGPSMWTALGGWIRGTTLIAAFHGVVVTTTLFVMGVPLAVPLGAFVFLGSFIPVAGAFLAGGLAVAITFASQGLVPAAVLLAVLVLLNQLEAHILQPFLIGRYVELNALAVVVALTTGGLLWGVPGAVLAVPLTAVVHAGLNARSTHVAETREQDDGARESPRSRRR